MFTKNEKDVLKELVLLEIEEVKDMLKTSLEIDKNDLQCHLKLLEQISNKLN